MEKYPLVIMSCKDLGTIQHNMRRPMPVRNASEGLIQREWVGLILRELFIDNK